MASDPTPTERRRQEILEALETVTDPELRQSIVKLGLVKRVAVCGDAATIDVHVSSLSFAQKKEIEKGVSQAVGSLSGIAHVQVNLSDRAGASFAKEPPGGGRRTIAIASGKGGVGKSTVATNLAVTLARQGVEVGLMDLDVWGPNVPLMMGLSGPPEVQGHRIRPLVAHGVPVMSIGFFLEARDPVIWRGPMVHNLIRQFIQDVEWGSCDTILADLPPGTGDVQISLSQSVPMTGGVIVSTPQDVSLMDARRSAEMFKKVHVPLLGLVENMSYFTCKHCNQRTEIFGHGGVERAARELEIPFLGEIPLDTEVRSGGDTGKPIVTLRPDGPIAKAFSTIAERLMESIAAPR